MKNFNFFFHRNNKKKKKTLLNYSSYFFFFADRILCNLEFFKGSRKRDTFFFETVNRAGATALSLGKRNFVVNTAAGEDGGKKEYLI